MAAAGFGFSIAEWHTLINPISITAEFCDWIATALSRLVVSPPEFRRYYRLFRDEDIELDSLALRLRGCEALEELQDELNEIHVSLGISERTGHDSPALVLYDSFVDGQNLNLEHPSTVDLVRSFLEQVNVEDLDGAVRNLTGLVDDIEISSRFDKYGFEPNQSETNGQTFISWTTWERHLRTIGKQYRELPPRDSSEHGEPLVVMRPPLDIRRSILYEELSIEQILVIDQGIKEKVICIWFIRHRWYDFVYDIVKRIAHLGQRRVVDRNSMRTMFTEMLSRSEEERAQQRRNTYHTRMATALYVAVAAITLLSTGFMDHFSTDRIKKIKTNKSGSTVPAFVASNGVLQEDDISKGLDPHRFMKLALILAELALAQPLEHDPDHGQKPFKLPAHGEEPPEFIRTGMLLLRVQRETSLLYENAVAHCLWEYNTMTPGNDMDADQPASRLIDCVLRPLAKHYNSIDRHHQKRKGYSNTTTITWFPATLPNLFRFQQYEAIEPCMARVEFPRHGEIERPAFRL